MPIWSASSIYGLYYRVETLYKGIAIFDIRIASVSLVTPSSRLLRFF